MSKQRDVEGFAEYYDNNAEMNIFSESPPESFDEALFRSPSPDPDRHVRGPSAPACTRIGFVPDIISQQRDELFNIQVPQDEYVNLLAESPPEAAGYQPRQPPRQPQHSPQMEQVDHDAAPPQYGKMFKYIQ